MTNLSNFPILFVDDDEMWLENTLRGLKILGIKMADGCSNPLEVMNILKNKNYGLVVIDLWMPQKPGEVLLNEIKQHYPNLPVIIITADNQIDTAVKCMQNGALNYLTKPIEPNKVITYIKQIVSNQSSKDTTSTNTNTNSNLTSPINYYSTLSQSKSMQKNFDYVDTLNQSILPILITGEKGSGKEHFARSIHSAHERIGDFITIDINTINDQNHYFGPNTESPFYNLVESKIGITVYFKNSDSLTAESQEYLFNYLQNLQDKYHNSIVNIQNLPRFIFSSTLNIIQQKLFINDLSFILKIQHIFIPPLRDRVIDISLLSNHFINQYVATKHINTPYIPKELLPLLEQYYFPGNILELKNMFEYALQNCNRGKLSMESFKEHMDLHRNIDRFIDSDTLYSSCNILPTLKEAQYFLIIEALKRTSGNQAHAAHLLGITRQGLNRKIQSFNIKTE